MTCYVLLYVTQILSSSAFSGLYLQHNLWCVIGFVSVEAGRKLHKDSVPFSETWCCKLLIKPYSFIYDWSIITRKLWFSYTKFITKCHFYVCHIIRVTSKNIFLHYNFFVSNSTKTVSLNVIKLVQDRASLKVKKISDKSVRCCTYI